MSVPVRYSAAANYAVVDSGLSNTLQQEEQYHKYQQQQQQQQQLYCQFAANANVNITQSNNINNNNNIDLSLGECNNYVNVNGNINGFEVQQQLMQQRSSMSSSVSPTAGLPANNNNNIANINNHRTRTPIVINNNNQISSSTMDNMNINNINVLQEEEEQHHLQHASHYHHQQQQHFDNHLAMSAEASACEQSELSSSSGVSSMGGAAAAVAEATNATMLAAAVAVAAANGSGSGAAMHHAVDVDVDEWRMSDEGRYGTPGAAGLEYQKYELEQQQQQSPANMMNQPLESSLMDNEKRNMKKNTNTNMKNSNSKKNNSTTNTDAKSANDAPNPTKKENELIGLSSDELYRMLSEYNVLQDKYHTVLLLPRESKREVTAGGRDGSAYVLRCLKMWYELPSDVLFSAMSLVDRFLDRMAVKPKHMACMSVASFHLAIKQLGLKPIPADELVTISQCGCTAGDLERMAGVIANKLGVQMGTTPVTAVTILRVFYALFRNLAKEVCDEFYEFYQRMIKLEDLENRLENLLCDVKTTVITPSTLALILMCLHLDFHIKASYKRERPELKPVFEYILFLQQYLRIPDRVFSCGFTIVADILSHYNGQNKQPYKQRLVWKLSSRTLKILRPTNRFSTDLPTIDEGQANAMDEGCRSRSESISSEEEEDWPTSPIIPIFEQC